MPHAVVVGGGIAGAATGIALVKAGWTAEVCEARIGAADEVGSWLTLQANGVDALAAIDAQQVITGAGVPTRTMRFVTGTGRVLGTLPNGSPLPDGTSSALVRRDALYAALRATARDRGVDVRVGARVTALSVDDGAVRLADGGSLQGDVVVGADGIRSLVRRAIDPAGPEPRYVPVLNVGGAVRDVDLSGTGWPDDAFQMLFGRRCFFGVHPLPGGGAVWFANPPQADEPGAAERAAIRDGFTRKRLLDLLADDRGPVADALRRVVARAAAADLRPWTTYDLPAVPRWHRGRAVLVGDAAHATAPSSGQGASLALEDAAVLARCLRDAPDPAAAFTAFEQLRRRRVERVVAVGKRGTSSKAAGPIGRVIRDAMLPVVFRMMSRDGGAATRWIVDHHLEWDAPVPT